MLLTFIVRWLSMYIRSVCAVLDFNANVDRPVKIVDGEIIYKLKVYTYIRHTYMYSVQCIVYTYTYRYTYTRVSHAYQHVHAHAYRHAHAHQYAHTHVHCTCTCTACILDLVILECSRLIDLESSAKWYPGKCRKIHLGRMQSTTGVRNGSR